MKLEKILDNVNSLEKNAFLKIIDSIKLSNPKNNKEIDKILSENSNDLKSADSINIARVFDLIKQEYVETVNEEIINITSQLDILLDILIKDGHCILRQDWLASLYSNELIKIHNRTQKLKEQLIDDKSEIDSSRRRDYNIYKACVEVAYTNDKTNNRDSRITKDELTILMSLAKALELSQEEVKLINYLIIPPEKIEIDAIISYLRNVGVIFYSKKGNTVYIADEVIFEIRKLRNKEVADKYFRRILKTFKEPQINTICKKHNIDVKDLTIEQKINSIIAEGVSLSNLLINGIFRDGTNLTEKKKLINELWENGLNISTPLRGVTLEEKVGNIIMYFEEQEKDEKVGISIEGYDKLLVSLNQTIPGFHELVLRFFEMHENTSIDSGTLLNYNIKPRDILDILPADILKEFASFYHIKTRGDLIDKILSEFKDVESLYIENYESIAYRDLETLKQNNISIKESELGIKFEEVTKSIFSKLGFNVDEKLKSEINTTKDKVDIILNLGNKDLIIVECKTVKENGYNKYSAVSRQIKSYVNLAKSQGFKVVKSLLVSPDFSDDFINECDLEFEINLSLITAGSLVKIMEGFNNSYMSTLPYQLLMKDVLIKEERILKALQK